MNYQYYDLGHLSKGQIVEVTIRGSTVNVMLMDSSNFSYYKRTGGARQYYGGHYQSSPVRLPVPRGGRWYVVINRGGYQGRWKSAVQILPGRLPAGRQAPLGSVPSLVHEPVDLPPLVANDGEPKTYDVFISHASEDKDAVVRGLAHELQANGLDVWYDEFELRIGDSLRRKIDKGLASSRFGVVVLSRAFFSKDWPNYELDGLVTKAVSGEQVILPVWHNISKAEVIAYSPSLADKLARSTSDYTVDEIAAEIADVIQARKIDAA